MIEFDPPLPGKLSLIQELRQVIASGQILFEGKPLIVDTFTDLQIWMDVIIDAQNAFGTITCKTSKRSFPLHNCQFISMEDSPIVIYQGTLYFSSSMIEWNILKKGWKSELFELDFKEIENLKELLEDKLTVTGESQEKPHPILQLTDSTGGFANLLVRYGNSKLAFTDTTKTLPNRTKRDFAEEKELEKILLETSFVKKNLGLSNYFCPLDKVQKSLQQLKSYGFTVLFQDKEVLLFSNKQMEWHAGDKLILKGSLNFEEGKKVSLADAVQSKDKFFTLSPTHVALLPDKNELGLPPGEPFEIAAGTLTYPRTSIGFSYSEMKDYQTPLQQFELIDPSPLFQGTLRPYQQIGLSWMYDLWKQKFAALLADDMGLGKTVQVLALLSHLPGPHCIVVPKSLIGNWQREIERFLPSQSGHITLTTYHTIRESIPEEEFETLIIDEAQSIKNSSTKLAQSLKKVKAKFRLSLTGTPIENHLNDLVSQFEFLLPGMVLIPDSKSLFKKVRPFILRRTKQEVLKDLPARDDQLIFVTMTEEQQAFYNDFLNKGKNNLLLKVKEDGVTKHRMEIFELILRLRQIACHPLLMTSDVATSGKLERVIEDLNSCIEEGAKVLIFSQFTSLLTLLKRDIKQHHPQHPFLYMDGDTKDRQSIVDQFQNDPSCQILISSLKVGGVGLNLTEADYVFILDPWWNDAVEEQAISRAHRLGRTKPVISRRYISQNTIEEKMLALKLQKKNLSDDLFSEELIELL